MQVGQADVRQGLEQLVELAEPGHIVRNLQLAEDAPIVGHKAQIMFFGRPVDAKVVHEKSSSLECWLRSRKILAAIAGLEDVLASRCIAIPMRRTDRKMTPFPADFEAAAIRHKLYTLALTHFAEVYRNYFERPKLHTLHNRSGELWSLLVALAAFFEEKGSVSGLLDAI